MLHMFLREMFVNNAQEINIMKLMHHQWKVFVWQIHGDVRLNSIQQNVLIVKVDSIWREMVQDVSCLMIVQLLIWKRVLFVEMER